MCKACLAAVCAMAGILVCSGSAQTDWSAKSGAVTIPAGEWWVADDADMVAVNALTSITFEDATAVLEFTGSGTTAPTVPFVGAGTVVKSGTGAWSYPLAAPKQSGFVGVLALSNGTISATATNSQLVAGTSSASGTIYVDGGSLIVPSSKLGTNPYRYEKLRLKGDGYDGQGALVIKKGTTNSKQFQNVQLEGDATLTADSYFWAHAAVQLNGHTLTFGGTASTMAYQSSQVKGPGAVRLTHPGSGTATREYSLRYSSASAIPFATADGSLLKFYLEPYTSLTVYNDDTEEKPLVLKSLEAEVHVGDGTGSLQNTQRYGTPRAASYTNHSCNVQGMIMLDTANSKLIVNNSGNKVVNAEMKISSPISGLGEVQVGTSTSPVSGRVFLANPTNCYAGDTTVYLQPYGSLGLASTNSIPNGDFTRLTCSDGRVSLVLNDEDDPWTPEAVARLANEVTWVGAPAISFDAVGRTNHVASYSGTAAISNEQLFVSAENDTRLNVTGPFAVTNRFKAYGGGTVCFTGTGRIPIGGVTAEQLKGGMVASPKVAFDGASNAVLVEGRKISLGMTDLSARMSVRNSSLGCEIVSNYCQNTSDYALQLGNDRNANAVLEVGEGAVMTNKLYVGHADGSVGAVYQSAGSVVGAGWHTSKSYDAQPAIGYGGHGYYELTGGSLRLLCRPSLCGGSGVGILHVDGGVFEPGKHYLGTLPPWFFLGRSSGPAVMYVRRGEANIQSDYLMALYTSNGDATITLAGPDARYKFDGGYNISWSGGNGKFKINLNDGIFESSSLARRTDTDNKRKNPDQVYVNFNGGTWKTATGASALFPQSVENNYLFKVRVYERGAVIDTDANKDPSIDVPLEAAFGDGVVSVALPDDLASGTYIAPPLVKIVNDPDDTTGDGASAYALFDSKTGKLTGVEVTAHGCGYAKAPTAEFYFDNTCVGTSVCTLGPNTSGSFTKKGKRTLTLNATNTWQGATILAGGKLKLGVDNAIPATTTFVLAGGTLDMNGKTLGDGAVTEPAKFGVDVPTALANGAGAYADFTFPAGATMTVTGADALPDFETARSVPLLKLTGTVPAALPEPAVVGTVAEGWKVRWIGGTLKAIPLRGTMLIVK